MDNSSSTLETGPLTCECNMFFIFFKLLVFKEVYSRAHRLLRLLSALDHELHF